MKNLIKKGLVTVNGEVIRKPEYKVDIEKDDLVCRGRACCLSDAGLLYA